MRPYDNMTDSGSNTLLSLGTSDIIGILFSVFFLVVSVYLRWSSHRRVNQVEPQNQEATATQLNKNTTAEDSKALEDNQENSKEDISAVQSSSDPSPEDKSNKIKVFNKKLNRRRNKSEKTTTTKKKG